MQIDDCFQTLPATDPQWYAIFTMPRHEKFVAKSFEQRQIECFLPVYEKLSSWKNRQRVNVMLPLFPRYIFAWIDRPQRLQVLQTSGVIRIVGAGSSPTPLPDAEIEFLRTAADRKRVEPYPDLVVGNRVCVKRGPMAGIEGVLVRKQNGTRFILTLQLIQQSVSIEIGAEDLETLQS
jgi:transcription antitermination factor NusG